MTNYYDDELLNDDERLAPADEFYEHLGNAQMGDDGEELIADEDTDMDSDAADDSAPTMDDTEAARGFRERLDNAPANNFDEDFTRALDPNENPHIGDQLDDANLQHDGDGDYR